jgi:hypothetical protein
MKRSRINALIEEAKQFFDDHQFYLPPFASWTPADWLTKGDEVREIVDNRLGWDITDFGSGDFENLGLLLFTLRNGHPSNWETLTGKLYAEKIMIVRAGQVTPLHFHWNKSEDIINRGGGDLALALFNATEDDELDNTPVTVTMDGVRRTFDAGETVVLAPGASITVPTRLYHRFWGEGETVMVGEVSLVNDDDEDNRFYEPRGRYPTIEEDEPPVHLLVMDHARYYDPQAAEG